MAAPSAAHAVLTNEFLLLHVGSFQSGLPHDLVELARAHHDELGKHRFLGIPPPWLAGGLLPAIAMENNDLKLLQRLYRYYQEQPRYRIDPRYMSFRFVWRDCLKSGDLQMVEWVNAQPALHEYGGRIMSHEVYQAFANRNQEIVKWLLTNRPEYKTKIKTHHAHAMLSQKDCLPLFQWLEATVVNLPCDTKFMDLAAGTGNLDMIQYLHAHRTEGCTSSAMDTAAKHGHLHVVRFLHDNRTEGCTTYAMDSAAAEGHLDIVRFLHDHRTEGCTVHAVNRASNIQVVRFLLEHRTEGCTSDAMDEAAARGDFDTVRFLHNHRTEGCTTRAMDDAARGGHLEIVRFLYGNRTEGCTKQAMDDAASNGHLGVVQFLHNECNVQGTRDAIRWAAKNGHLEIVQFLYAHGFERDYWSAVLAAASHGHLKIEQFFTDVSPVDSMAAVQDTAAQHGHLVIVQFLHERSHTKHCASTAMHMATIFDHFDVVKYLNDHCKSQRQGLALIHSASYGYFRIVRYLVEHRADGCLVCARREAKRAGRRLVEDYLTSWIDPAADCNPNGGYHHCNDHTKRRCQKKWKKS